MDTPKPWTLDVFCPNAPECEGIITVSVVQHVGPGYYYGLQVEDVTACPVCGMAEAKMEEAAYARLAELQPD